MPTIVFRMKMKPDAQSYPLPVNKDHATYQAEVAAQRVSWLPSFFKGRPTPNAAGSAGAPQGPDVGNSVGGNRELKDGVTFTCTGDEAIYLRDLVNNGVITFVEIVSTTP